MSKDAQTIGTLLRSLREKRGLSVRQLAELSGINHANISRLETGVAPRSTMGGLTKIAEALGVDPTRLYKAAGITDLDTALPSFRPYLRAKYSHLPKEKLAELAEFFDRMEAEQAEKRSNKR